KQLQADLQIISMLHQQNIFHEEDIPLENQSSLINNYDKKLNRLVNSLYYYNFIDLENTCNNSDILLDETFQDYKSHDNLFQADTISESLIQESTNLLFEESSQATLQQVKKNRQIIRSIIESGIKLNSL
ncbi:20000_t:CDS:2, partial [Racocetra persica]